MTKEIDQSKEITENFKEKYKDESLEDRTSRWVLGTIKFQYDIAYIIASGALNEENSSKENFDKLAKKKQCGFFIYSSLFNQAIKEFFWNGE